VSNKTVIVADDTAFVRDRFATALVGAGVLLVPDTTLALLLVPSLRASRRYPGDDSCQQEPRQRATQ